MERVSAHELAQEIIDDCLDYGRWPNRALEALLERALDERDVLASTAATSALFSVVIERLGDLFDPQLCDVYVRLFTRIIGRVLPELTVDDLQLRYRKIRHARSFAGGEVSRVFVLSRVTLGADVAVTSVVLNAAKQRFPEAEICFVGPSKNAELFAADSRVVAIPVAYSRTSALRERLLAAAQLRSIVDEPASIVLDPDSRLTQLGLIPICDDGRYYFFESRAFGGVSQASLPELTALWLEQTLDIPYAQPYVAPDPQAGEFDCCVSWGVGENDNKRIGYEFELAVIKHLLSRGRRVLIDRGAGGDEGDRVDALANQIQSPHLQVNDGSYSSFAAKIVKSALYVGYDSAGQHVAAAAGVPLVSIFAGYASERMFWRWKPTGDRVSVLREKDDGGPSLLDRTLSEIDRLLP